MRAEKIANGDTQVVEVPSYDQLIWPTVKAMKALGGSGSNKEIYDKLVELEGYSEEIQQVPASENASVSSLLEYRSYWARTYLKKYGAIESSGRAVWVLLDKGEKLTEAEVSKISSIVRKQDRLHKQKQEATEEFIKSEEDGADEEDWKENLLNVLKEMDPSAFERLCQRILRENGFTKVQVTGRSGDGGIDGIGILRINLLSFHVSFQCKRYKDSVGAGAIRDFRGAMVGRGDKGLFITTGSYTPDARKEASRDGAPAIDLIDGEELCDLLKDLKLGVHTEMTEKVMLKPEWFKDI
ncbi:MAG: restriction endonuclease [Micavibrio sp.]|nr:restriction endonuclease [Micavibrio sp.]MBK9561898.1 restriction endonuclease [Micavibrio sp.]